MRKFAIVRQAKTRSAEAFNAIRFHNERLRISENVDSSKTHLNVFLQKRLYPNMEVFAEKKRAQIQAANKKNGTNYRMVKKEHNNNTNKKEYKSMSQEIVFSFSRHALNREQAIKYFRRIDKRMREWFANIEVLSSVIHFDEMTPHLHYEVSYFDKVACRFVQDALTKQGLTHVNAIRDAIQSIADEYGLERQDGSVVVDRIHESKASLEAMGKRERTEALDQQNNDLKAILTARVWEFDLADFTVIAEERQSNPEDFLSKLENLGIKVKVVGLNDDGPSDDDVVAQARARNQQQRNKHNSHVGPKRNFSPT